MYTVKFEVPLLDQISWSIFKDEQWITSNLFDEKQQTKIQITKFRK